jgi:histidine triad (HIT) family protein
VAGEAAADVVHEDGRCVAFLDHRPLRLGHVLLVPRAHVPTFLDLPDEDAGPLFLVARRLARAMEEGLGAEGSFVGLNNRVSQSVPHLHVHVVPRRRADGLRGFFWPRESYASAQARQEVCRRLREALGQPAAREGAGPPRDPAPRPADGG